MLSIRLARFGKKKQPTYRVVVCQKHKDPFGDYIENVGTINYFGGKKNINLNTERITYWLSQGAQATDTVHNLFVSEGIVKDKKKLPNGIKPGLAAKAKAEAEQQAKKEAKEKEEAEKQAKAEADAAAKEAEEEKPATEEAVAEPEEKKE